MKLEELLNLHKDPIFVASLQERLEAHGIEIVVDGVWGPQTAGALERFAIARNAPTTFCFETLQELFKGLDSKDDLDDHRHVNDHAIKLMHAFEGLRLVAYRCPANVWTIGWGTTKGVYPGMEITEKQADEFFRRDLQKFEKAVLSLTEGLALTDGQFGALVSFAYNCGENALATSTLLKRLHAKQYDQVASEFLRWNRGGGRELAGLTRRRKAERALFLGEDFTQFL